MKIRDLTLSGKTVLAPLAGITHLPFRSIVKACGCALVCSEMISAKGLMYNSRPTFELLDTTEQERPLSVQIFGAEPDSMAAAAALIEQKGCADVIDINFGCSVKKVAKTGAGVSLMKDPERARDVIRAVRDAVSLPFTIKIRSGWDPSGDQAMVIGTLAQENGVDAVTLHPRTAQQGFRGRADWSLIKRLKQALDIPVIGNGDITEPEDALAMLRETGCDAVMVGRAAMGNPFIFAGIESLVRGEPWAPPTSREVFRVMEALFTACIDYFGEDKACRMMRGKLEWFVRGMPGSRTFRREMSKTGSQDEVFSLMASYETILAAGEGALWKPE